MSDEKSERSLENPVERATPALAVERVGPCELDTVARVLAAGYAEDPLHLWAMPKAATRLADATMFFTFYLRWMKRRSWEVFATADRSAVLVTSRVHRGESVYPDGVRHLPELIRIKSPVNDYIQWIETFRPNLDHHNLDFMGQLPTARRAIEFFLLESVLKMFDEEGLPVWTWSSKPVYLPIYRRLGFEIGAELRRDPSTPPVTIIWRPPKPSTDEGESL